MVLRKKRFARFVFLLVLFGCAILFLPQLVTKHFAANDVNTSHAFVECTGNDGIIVSNNESIKKIEHEDTAKDIVLVNADHPISENYKPNLVSIEGKHRIDQKAYAPLMQMLKDAKAAGLHPEINSAYRTFAEQEALYNRKVRELTKKGYSKQAAYERAQSTVASKGNSEHHLGLAVDIVSRSHRDLDENFGETPEGIWLQQNCHKYGFVLRYPDDKTQITKIIYEPWHFRWVGKDAAREMTDNDLCLEEYLE